MSGFIPTIPAEAIANEVEVTKKFVHLKMMLLLAILCLVPFAFS